MQDFMMELARQGYIIPLGAILSGALIAVTAIVLGGWSKMRRQDMESALKHKMLDQGMSADDIQKVLEASSDGRRGGIVPGQTG